MKDIKEMARLADLEAQMVIVFVPVCSVHQCLRRRAEVVSIFNNRQTKRTDSASFHRTVVQTSLKEYEIWSMTEDNLQASKYNSLTRAGCVG